MVNTESENFSYSNKKKIIITQHSYTTQKASLEHLSNKPTWISKTNNIKQILSPLI